MCHLWKRRCHCAGSHPCRVAVDRLFCRFQVRPWPQCDMKCAESRINAKTCREGFFTRFSQSNLQIKFILFINRLSIIYSGPTARQNRSEEGEKSKWTVYIKIKLTVIRKQFYQMRCKGFRSPISPRVWGRRSSSCSSLSRCLLFSFIFDLSDVMDGYLEVYGYTG